MNSGCVNLKVMILSAMSCLQTIILYDRSLTQIKMAVFPIKSLKMPWYLKNFTRSKL